MENTISNDEKSNVKISKFEKTLQPERNNEQVNSTNDLNIES